jgi:hypothetical protein
MNREQLFVKMEQVFTGKEDEKHSTIREYWNLDPEAGYLKADQYLKESKSAQDSCQSDWSYWAYEGDITLATVLRAVFAYMKSGHTEFPELSQGGSPFLMDRTSCLQQWAGKLGGKAE